MHRFPQLPQLSGSLDRSTQLVPQALSPPPQSMLQVPDLQRGVPSPAGQALLHEPQWFGSVSVSTQAPRHSSSPVRHSKSQPPAEQIASASGGAVQALPQSPQFLGSLSRSTQSPEHSTVLGAQSLPQSPSVHTSSEAQRMPQAPQ